jgi:putative ABC transport system permease protein
MKHNPPRFAKKILHRFCPLNFLEEIEGDLDEQFYERLPFQGLFKARLHYFLDVFWAIKPNFASGDNPTKPQGLSFRDRLNHFFLVAFRNLWRSRTSSFINVIGLCLSLTTFLLIYAYLDNESTYDSFHPNADKVYRISHSYTRNHDGQDETDARAAGLWAVSLKETFPEVKCYTRFSRFGWPGFVKYEKEDKVFIEQQFFWVDSTYTDIFSLPLVDGGNARQVLKHPNQLILNETTAKKYFGKTNPIGQTLIYSRAGMDFSLVVGGVMKNYPSNSHFHPDFIANNQTLNPLWKRDNEERINSWRDAFTYSFIELEEETDVSKIKRGLQNIFVHHFGENAKTTKPILTKLTDIHFTSGMLIELEPAGDKVYLYLFGSIALLILFIASINYMNLATARSVKRSKEVGLRKTLGAKRSSLIFQFLGESFLITFIAILISVILMLFLLPSFNGLTSKEISTDAFMNIRFFLVLAVLVFALAVVSGSYPAFYLSAFSPMQVLKGKFVSGKESVAFRKILIVFQFSVSVLLIVSTLVVHRQLEYINSTNLSESGEQVLTIRLGGLVNTENIENFSTLAKQNHHVKEIALGDHLPRLENFGWIDKSFTIHQYGNDPHTWQHLRSDSDFSSMFNLEFIAGRNFSNEIPSDTGAYILNESAAKDLNITPEQAIGLVMSVQGYESNEKTGTVIGVVKDFNYASARKKILPLALSGQFNEAETLYIKLNGGNFEEAIESLTMAWKKVFPSTPFQHWFMDEEFGRLYKQEIQMGKVFNFFSGFTIIIACLGLFGLASFTAEQKTKEIGIRKVLGASSLQIILLLTNYFVKLVVIALVIAIPTTFILMQNWLDGFAYRVEFSWLAFVWVGFFVLLLTYITVGIESARASLANPVDSIKYE